MKDIRLLGDIVKHQLVAWKIPVNLYIGIENLLMLIITAKVSYTIPFVGVVDNFQSLALILIGVIYGYQSSLKALAVYLLLGCLGLPVFDSNQAGIDYILQSQQIGLLIGYIPATIVAATLATYHWDRHLGLSLILFFFCLIIVHLLAFAVLKAHHLIQSGIDLTFFSSSICLEAIIGALFISLCWQITYVNHPELRK